MPSSIKNTEHPRSTEIDRHHHKNFTHQRASSEPGDPQNATTAARNFTTTARTSTAGTRSIQSSTLAKRACAPTSRDQEQHLRQRLGKQNAGGQWLNRSKIAHTHINTNTMAVIRVPKTHTHTHQHARARARARNVLRAGLLPAVSL